MSKLIAIDAAGATVSEPITQKNEQGADVGNETRWTLRADQVEKHRAMFPEIDADPQLRAKADALKVAK